MERSLVFCLTVMAMNQQKDQELGENCTPFVMANLANIELPEGGDVFDLAWEYTQWQHGETLRPEWAKKVCENGGDNG